MIRFIVVHSRFGDVDWFCIDTLNHTVVDSADDKSALNAQAEELNRHFCSRPPIPFSVRFVEDAADARRKALA